MRYSSLYGKEKVKKYDPNVRRLDVDEYNNMDIIGLLQNHDITIVKKPDVNWINKDYSKDNDGCIKDISLLRDSAYLLAGDLLKQLTDWFNINGVKEIV